MSSQAEHFRDVVMARLTAIGRRTDTLIGKADGPSTSTMTKIRAGAYSPRDDTMSKIDAACDWQAGSSWRVWDGEEPAPVGGGTEDGDYVGSVGARVEGGDSNEQVLQAIREMRAEQQRVLERLDRLEQRNT